MAVVPFRRINTPNAELMRIQDAVAETFASLVRNPLLNGNFVEVSLGTSTSEVSHGLGRKVEGWFLVRKDAEADVWEPSASGTPTKTLRLAASAAVNVTVYFF